MYHSLLGYMSFTHISYKFQSYISVTTSQNYDISFHFERERKEREREEREERENENLMPRICC